jgi:pimeloyl-ACP methyl ester carboxylesterase
MLARLQQITTLSLLAFAIAWAAFFAQRQQMLVAIGGALCIVFGYALILGVEFVLLYRVNQGGAAAPARVPVLLKAWCGEVASAARVFFWQQPFRSNSVADHRPALGSRSDSGSGSGRAGVVLVHGFACNRGIWNPWLRRLRALDIPFVAVNLEALFAGIDTYVATIDAAVRHLRDATGRAPVIVAHSMGGLAVRAWLDARGAGEQPQHVITIGTPHHGTELARFAIALNARQMRRQSAWLGALGNRESRSRFASFTCYYSDCDNIVMPAVTATLSGADNRQLHGVAHVQMATDERIFRDVLERALRGLQAAQAAPH